MVLVALPLVVVVLATVKPLPLGMALVTLDCCAGVVDSTGRLEAPLDWTVPLHSELEHLNAGRSVGTGGGDEPKVVGIVGGGTALASTLRGITAKFG